MPSELPDRWLPGAKRRESIVAAWKDIRERRLHAEMLAWPVEMQVYPKGVCLCVMICCVIIVWVDLLFSCWCNGVGSELDTIVLRVYDAFNRV